MNNAIEMDIQHAVNRLTDIVHRGTYLVTGATGMIGRYIVKMLLGFGNVKVIAACRSKEKAKQIFSVLMESENLSIIEFDVCEPDWAIEGSVDYIIHTAGICDNKFCEQYPGEVIRVNTLGTYEALKFAEQKSSKKVLVFSSASVYGKLEEERLSENVIGYVDFTNVYNSYAISKRAAENICQSYMFRIPICVVRPFHIISPEMIYSSSSMMGEFFKKLCEGEKIEINGDGLLMRNFTYIVDMCETVLLLNELCTGTYNIGNVNGDLSVLGMLQMMNAVLEKKGFMKEKRSVIQFGRKTNKPSNKSNLLPMLSRIESVYERRNYKLKMNLPEQALEKCINKMEEMISGTF